MTSFAAEKSAASARVITALAEVPSTLTGTPSTLAEVPSTGVEVISFWRKVDREWRKMGRGCGEVDGGTLGDRHLRRENGGGWAVFGCLVRRRRRGKRQKSLFFSVK